MTKTQVERGAYRVGDLLELKSSVGTHIAVYCGMIAACDREHIEFYFPTLNPHCGGLFDVATDNIFRIIFRILWVIS